MFNTMVKDESGPETEKETGKPFAIMAQALLLAMALGIAMNDKRSPKERKQWLTRGEYIANTEGYKAIRQLLKSKYDLKSDKEVFDASLEYAEAGVRELFDEYKKTKDIDFLRISRIAP